MRKKLHTHYIRKKDSKVYKFFGYYKPTDVEICSETSIYRTTIRELDTQFVGCNSTNISKTIRKMKLQNIYKKKK